MFGLFNRSVKYQKQRRQEGDTTDHSDHNTLCHNDTQILAKRKEEIEASYTEAEKAEGDAQAMKEEYETRLASAKEEAAEIVKSATARANARGEELVSAARAEAAALKSKADAEIESERRKAAGELKNDISELALDIAGRVVEKEIDPETHKELIDDFISRVGDAS